jgi:hypothetical protein
MADALKTAPGWSLWYGDSTAVIYRADGAPVAAIKGAADNRPPPVTGQHD